MKPELTAFIEMRLEDGPIKGVDLAVECAAAHIEDITGKDIIDTMELLVQQGKAVEVEYVLPKMNYRAKSIYFPKGTEIRLNRSEADATRSVA